MHQQYLAQASSQLNYMSSDELRELFSNDEKLDERIDELLKPLEQEKDDIIEENRRIAERNLNKEPQLIEMRANLNELTSEGKELSQNVQDKLAILKSKTSSINPESMLDILKASSAESEETSDKFVDEFYDKNLTIEEFLEKFKAARIEMHLRKLKAEKMQELIRQRGGGVSHAHAPAGYPTQPMSNFYGSPNAAPYPSMPGFPMPMPPSSYRPPY